MRSGQGPPAQSGARKRRREGESGDLWRNVEGFMEGGRLPRLNPNHDVAQQRFTGRDDSLQNMQHINRESPNQSNPGRFEDSLSQPPSYQLISNALQSPGQFPQAPIQRYQQPDTESGHDEGRRSQMVYQTLLQALNVILQYPGVSPPPNLPAALAAARPANMAQDRPAIMLEEQLRQMAETPRSNTNMPNNTEFPTRNDEIPIPTDSDISSLLESGNLPLQSGVGSKTVNPYDMALDLKPVRRNRQSESSESSNGSSSGSSASSSDSSGSEDGESSGSSSRSSSEGSSSSTNRLTRSGRKTMAGKSAVSAASSSSSMSSGLLDSGFVPEMAEQPELEKYLGLRNDSESGTSSENDVSTDVRTAFDTVTTKEPRITTPAGFVQRLNEMLGLHLPIEGDSQESKEWSIVTLQLGLNVIRLFREHLQSSTRPQHHRAELIQILGNGLALPALMEITGMSKSGVQKALKKEIHDGERLRDCLKSKYRKAPPSLTTAPVPAPPRSRGKGKGKRKRSHSKSSRSDGKKDGRKVKSLSGEEKRPKRSRSKKRT